MGLCSGSPKTYHSPCLHEATDSHRRTPPQKAYKDLMTRPWLWEIVKTFVQSWEHTGISFCQESFWWRLNKSVFFFSTKENLFSKNPQVTHFPQGPKKTNSVPKGTPGSLGGPSCPWTLMWGRMLVPVCQSRPLALQSRAPIQDGIQQLPVWGGTPVNALKGASLSQSLQSWQRGHLHLWISLISPVAYCWLLHQKALPLYKLSLSSQSQSSIFQLIASFFFFLKKRESERGNFFFFFLV